MPAGEVYAAVEAPKGEFGVSRRRRHQQAVSRQAARARGSRICRPWIFSAASTCSPTSARSWVRSTRSARWTDERALDPFRSRNREWGARKRRAQFLYRGRFAVSPKSSPRASPSRPKTWHGRKPKSRKNPRPQASAVIALLLARAGAERLFAAPRAAIEAVADMLAMPYMRVLEVATFYTMFNLALSGAIASSSAARRPVVLRGAGRQASLQVPHRRRTPCPHRGRRLSVVEVECLGACCNAPMVQINDDYTKI